MARSGPARIFHCNSRAVSGTACACNPMFHSNTERLIDYWRARKPGRLSPARGAIDPRDFAELAPQMLILGRPAPGRFRFRLVGGVIAELIGRDLRGADFASLWAVRDRPGLATALEAARRTAEPLVLTAEIRARNGRTAPAEILLAPLRADAAPRDRMLGCLQPLQPLSMLLDEPVEELTLVRLASAEEGPALPSVRLATVNGRRIA